MVGTEKSLSYLDTQHFKRCYANMSLVFLKMKKLSKCGYTWIDCNELKQTYELKNGYSERAFNLKFVLKTIYVSTVNILPAIKNLNILGPLH